MFRGFQKRIWGLPEMFREFQKRISELQKMFWEESNLNFIMKKDNKRDKISLLKEKEISRGNK